MSKKDDEKALAPAQNTAVAQVVDLGYEDESGQGFENADIDSFAIPFLSVLQDLSPQVKKTEPEYIKGAEAGMLFNSVTQQVYDGDTGITIVPCYYKRTFINWKLRSDGGGFLGEYPPTHPVVSQTTRTDKGDILPNGTMLVDTRVHYVLILGGEAGPQMAVLSLSSTQVKKSRQWMSRMEGLKLRRADGSLFTPPMFAHSWKLTSVPERNDQGSWYGLRFDQPQLQLDAAIKKAASEFRTRLVAGEVKESYAVPAGVDEVEM